MPWSDYQNYRIPRACYLKLIGVSPCGVSACLLYLQAPHTCLLAPQGENIFHSKGNITNQNILNRKNSSILTILSFFSLAIFHHNIGAATHLSAPPGLATLAPLWPPLPLTASLRSDLLQLTFGCQRDNSWATELQWHSFPIEWLRKFLLIFQLTCEKVNIKAVCYQVS